MGLTDAMRERSDDSVTETDLSSSIPLKNLRKAGEEDRRASVMSGSDSKLNNINSLRGNRTNGKPAELFRKDLISAMKLPDSEPLQPEDFLTIADPWRQEWERGVQVPVNPHIVHKAEMRIIEANESLHGLYPFKLPSKKFLHSAKDDQFQSGLHELHETDKLAETVCRYDLDIVDVHWLTIVNGVREDMGVEKIEEWIMERVIEELETQCHDKMEVMIKTVAGLGIEYDENIVCDVCRSPDSEDTNEMVFCDNCDICVHQACYGVLSIPEGSWLCRTCALGIRPQCVLCPNSGGAMKSTKIGTKWAHVSCALWTPEVSIGCAEKMEPITQISQIPASRWSLICNVCRERTGSCIQCSVKSCKASFHVSCAFKNGFDMKTLLCEDGDEEIQLKAFCAKHSRKFQTSNSPRKDPSSTPKKVEDMTEEEKQELRSHRLKKAAEEFYTLIKVEEVAEAVKLPEEMVDFIYAYWTFKRKSNFNKPLMTPKREEEDLLLKQSEDSLVARMKMFVHLRQDLERVRNLCYMVGKREKMRRRLYRMKEEVFKQQLRVLEHNPPKAGTREWTHVSTAHKMPNSMYDKYDIILQHARLQDPNNETSMKEQFYHELERIRIKREIGRPKKDLCNALDNVGSNHIVRGSNGKFATMKELVVKETKPVITSPASDLSDSKTTKNPDVMKSCVDKVRRRGKVGRPRKYPLPTLNPDPPAAEPVVNHKLPVPNINPDPPAAEPVVRHKLPAPNINPDPPAAEPVVKRGRGRPKRTPVPLEQTPDTSVIKLEETPDTRDSTKQRTFDNSEKSSRSLRTRHRESVKDSTESTSDVPSETDPSKVLPVKSHRTDSQGTDEVSQSECVTPFNDIELTRPALRSSRSSTPNIPSPDKVTAASKSPRKSKLTEAKKSEMVSPRRSISGLETKESRIEEAANHSLTEDVHSPEGVQREKKLRSGKRRSRNGLSNHLVVSQSIRDKVHRSLNKVNSRHHRLSLNGISSQYRKIESYFSPRNGSVKKQRSLSPKPLSPSRRDNLEVVSRREGVKTVLRSSPLKTGTGLRLTKRSLEDLQPGYGVDDSPRGRSKRRRIDSDLESNSSEFEGRQLRSRSATPDSWSGSRHRRSSGQSKRYSSSVTLRSRSSIQGESEDEPVDVESLDDESDTSCHSMRRRSQEEDELSRDSNSSSNSRFNRRSRINENWSFLAPSLTTFNS